MQVLLSKTVSVTAARFDRSGTPATNAHAAFALGGMPRVQIFRHVLFLLRRHSGGIRLARNAPGPKQSTRHIVFAQARLSIVELSAAAVTWFHVWSPASGLFKGAVPAGRNPAERGPRV